ncbi:porin [Paraburkholderia sp. GAS32]|uniref:porin n=1 Tax=Paraburkholderia sp. GAS32 TaxID=3035129 RepID=UPI003D1EC26C
MKKKTIVLAVSVASAVCVAPVSAQSNVTLYGVIDEGFNYTNDAGGKSVYELQSGYAQGSRWGLKGTEDLGDGLKAVFQLENGFNVNNGKLGQGGLLFGRQAYMGLTDARLGSLTFGRQYDSVVDYLGQLTANGNWAGYLFSHPFDNDNTDNTFRVNNTVKYTSSNLAGVQFGGTYSFSNDPNFANNRQYSVGAQYANGGLLAAAAYLQANNPSATSGGAINNGGDENFVAQRLRVFGVGFTYTFGAATAGFVYTNTNVTHPVSDGYLSLSESIQPTTGALAGGTLNALKFQNFELNGKYQVTPEFFLGAQYVYTVANYEATTGSVKPKIHSVGLMADYNLSKRTDAYVQGVFQKIAGAQTGSSLDQAYIPGADDLSSSSHQAVVRVGLRHLF